MSAEQFRRQHFASSRRQRRLRRGAVGHPRPLRFETLEGREMLAFNVMASFDPSVTVAKDRTDIVADVNQSGASVAAWEYAASSTNHDIFLRLYDAAGGALSGTETTIANGANNETDPRVSLAYDGSSVVTYTDTTAGDVYFQRVSSAGATVGSPVSLFLSSGATQSSIDVAVAPSGQFVVAWDELQSPTTGHFVLAQAFNSSGVATTTIALPGSTALAPATKPRVAIAPNGDFVVAWQITTGVMFRRYSATGVPKGAAQTLSIPVESPGDVLEDVDVAMKPDTSFLLGFTRVPITGGVAAEDAEWALMSSAGAVVTHGKAFTTGFGTHSAHVAVDAKGDFVIGYSLAFTTADDDAYFSSFSATGLFVHNYTLAMTAGNQRVTDIAYRSGRVVGGYTNDASSPATVQMFFANQMPSILGRTSSGQWWAGLNNNTGLTNVPIGSWDSSAGWRDVFDVDFDGDGDVDALGRTSTGGWWFGRNDNGILTNIYLGAWNEGAGWSFVQTVDYDNDGDLDVLALNSGGAWVLGRNMSSTSLSFSTVGSWGAPSNFADVHAVDYDGDGDVDVLGRIVTGQWFLGRNNGSGLLINEFVGYWSPSLTYVDVSAVDLNGDGLIDVVGRSTGGAWWVGLNNGSTLVNVYYGAWDPTAGWRDVSAVDLDGDGKVDVVGRTSTGAWWWGRNTGSAFVSVFYGVWDESANWKDVMYADFDQDGDTDVLGRTSGGGWWLGRNNGSNSFVNVPYGFWDGTAGWTSVGNGRFGEQPSTAPTTKNELALAAELSHQTDKPSRFDAAFAEETDWSRYAV